MVYSMMFAVKNGNNIFLIHCTVMAKLFTIDVTCMIYKFQGNGVAV